MATKDVTVPVKAESIIINVETGLRTVTSRGAGFTKESKYLGELSADSRALYIKELVQDLASEGFVDTAEEMDARFVKAYEDSQDDNNKG